MDPKRFDALARTLASRRAAARGLAGMAAAGALGSGLAAPLATVATKKKKKGKRGYGCAKHDNACSGGLVRCPEAPSGFCFLRGGKPVCAALNQCAACTKDSECAQLLGKGARCLKDCPACQVAGVSSICILPQSKTKG